MNAAGIALVAVADQVLGFAGRLAHALHLIPVGNPAPPRPRRPLCWISCKTPSESSVPGLCGARAKPLCRRYSSRLVGSIWPEFSVARCFCGPRNEHTGFSLRIDCLADRGFRRWFVGQQSSEQSPRAVVDAAQQALGPEVPEHNRFHILAWTRAYSCVGPRLGTTSTSGVWWHMPTQPRA